MPIVENPIMYFIRAALEFEVTTHRFKLDLNLCEDQLDKTF